MQNRLSRAVRRQARLLGRTHSGRAHLVAAHPVHLALGPLRHREEAPARRSGGQSRPDRLQSGQRQPLGEFDPDDRRRHGGTDEPPMLADQHRDRHGRVGHEQAGDRQVEQRTLLAGHHIEPAAGGQGGQREPRRRDPAPAHHAEHGGEGREDTDGQGRIRSGLGDIDEGGDAGQGHADGVGGGGASGCQLDPR